MGLRENFGARFAPFAQGLAAALLLSSLELSVARAQTLQSPREPLIVLPRAKRASSVSYPTQALDQGIFDPVTVDLVLQVDAAGRVTEAKVLSPRGHGFDEAAVHAALQLAFEPATRDGRPIAARIKFRYQFTPPAARLAGQVRSVITDAPIAGALVAVRDSMNRARSVITASDGSWSISALPPGPVHVSVSGSGLLPSEADERLVAEQELRIILRLRFRDARLSESGAEVEVKGVRPAREVTVRSLSRDEIRHSAGTQGDALLSIQNLPGIARPPPFSGALVVRGSAPDDTLVLVDGTEVPLAYHFGGLSSVVPTELLEKIDFYPGNFGSRYGRAMGGIVEAQLRAPRLDGYHLVIENSLLGARAIVEGPLGRGFSFFLAGQRSWLDLLITPLLKAQGEAQTALPHWADYQAAIQKDFSHETSLRVLFFGASDGLNIVDPIANASDPSLSGALAYHTSFWRAQAKLESRISSSTRLKWTAAYGEDRLALGLGNNLIDATLHPLTSRAELSQRVMPGLQANLGFDVLHNAYDFALQLPAPTRPGIPSGGPGQPPVRSTGSASLFQPGLYAELELAPWLGCRIVPGLRGDYDRTTESWDVSPRLFLRQDLTRTYPKTTLKAGAGVYLQPPGPLDTAPNLGQRGLTSNRAEHYDLGFEQEFTRQLELSMDLFYKRFDHLVVTNALNAGTGSAHGAEWLLRYKSDGRFFGWLAYTLSRSERRDVPEEPSRRFQFDQTHVLTLVGNYKLGRGWQLGGRFRITSGDLYTPLGTGAYNASSGSQLGVAAFPPFDSRLPAFNQLDLRIEKTRVFRNLRSTVFLDLQNVYNAKNPLGLSYNYNYTQSAPTRGLPLFPILGIRVEMP